MTKNTYRVLEDTVEILCESKGILVSSYISSEDLDKVSCFRWCVTENSKRLKYLSSRIYGRKTYLHRFIMGDPLGIVDHIDGNGLNNVKSNLRVCSKADNCRNSFTRSNRKFKGPVKRKNGRFTSYIKVNYKSISLGTYDTEKEAAIAYNKAALEYFGEFARLNTVD